VWVREALGPRWGSLAAWFYWINNAYWVPSVYMVFAGTFHTIFLVALPPALQEGPARCWLQAASPSWPRGAPCAGRGAAPVSKWVPNLGRVVKVRDLPGLGALGFASLRWAGPRATISPPPQFVRAGATRCSTCPCSSTTRSASS
jgi:amino acid transporter